MGEFDDASDVMGVSCNGEAMLALWCVPRKADAGVLRLCYGGSRGAEPLELTTFVVVVLGTCSCVEAVSLSLSPNPLELLRSICSITI